MEKALLAKSVRDFEEAISMISYGFVDIEDFYTKSSTRNMIKDVKIPVLFVQVSMHYFIPLSRLNPLFIYCFLCIFLNINLLSALLFLWVCFGSE